MNADGDLGSVGLGGVGGSCDSAVSSQLAVVSSSNGAKRNGNDG